jgi:ABC-type Mn/Zn transport systems, ATPase component
MALRSLIHKSVPHQAGAPVVEFSHVSVRYNGEPALDDVSFTIPRGERTAIPTGPGRARCSR